MSKLTARLGVGQQGLLRAPGQELQPWLVGYCLKELTHKEGAARASSVLRFPGRAAIQGGAEGDGVDSVRALEVRGS